MKSTNTCDTCGKRAKKIPRQQGFNLCHKHYQLKLKNEQEGVKNK